jgi:hypothetical protein
MCEENYLPFGGLDRLFFPCISASANELRKDQVSMAEANAKKLAQ